MAQITVYPAAVSVVSGSPRSTKYKNAVGKGSSTTASGNDYASSGTTATIAYTFDFSSIPEGATIDSVEVKVGGHAESSTYTAGTRMCDLQLYSGDTAKGTKTHFTSTGKQVLTLNAGTWTYDELQQAQLRVTIGYYGGLVNGVDFTVNYTGGSLAGAVLFKPTGSDDYVRVKKLLRKSGDSGAYVEITKDNLPDKFIYKGKDAPVTFLASDGGLNTQDGQPLFVRSTGNWEETYTSKFTGQQFDELLTQAGG